MLTYDDANLGKHNVSREEVDQVLDSRNLTTEVFELPPAENGNDRVLFVGVTFAGRILEVGIEMISSDDEHIFHAMDATKQYR